FSESCVQCTSEKHPRCAIDSMNMLPKDCTNSTSHCYTRVLNGHTIRGCTSDLPSDVLQACNNESECVTCSNLSGCNNQIFPQHRAQCMQCSGSSVNSTCATEVFAPFKVCPLYSFGDECYIRNSQRVADGSFQRGCLSSAQANKQCIKKGNCYTCLGRGCNYLYANNTQIPLARDSAVSAVLSLSLLLVCGLASLLML
ncbi:hypothetical protein KR222_009013, partial [Zaprionus bogoriensis]